MHKLRRFFCLPLICILCLLTALPAAAEGDTRSFALHPDSDKQAAVADINAFFSGLSADAVQSLQVIYKNPQEVPGLSHEPTPIDPAEYPTLIALLQKIRLSVPAIFNPYTGAGLEYYLAVTTREATVKLGLWGTSNNRTVFGSLGEAGGLRIEPEQGRGPITPYTQLEDKISALPAVQEAVAELEEKFTDYWTGQTNAADKQEGLARMNGPALPPDPENPPALAVSSDSVAEYNLFQDGYWARVTNPADQQKLLNLVNGIDTRINPSTSPMQGGRVLLQLRLQDGEKHEYQTSKTICALSADGNDYYDPSAALIFDEALGGMLSGYPVGIAWLGTMNRRNVVEMAVEGADGRSSVYSLERDPQALEKAVIRLRGITLQGGSSRRVPLGSLPEELKGKAASHRVRLQFQNGIAYQLDFYGERMLTLSSSDMSFSYFYQCDRIREAA